MKKKTICVPTFSRSEYGLLYWTINEILKSKNFNLQLIVSGTHLSKKHGMTIKQIQKDKFPIFKKIKLNTSNDSSADLARFSSELITEFSKTFSKNRPDALLILGDRFELLPLAHTATVFGIPIIHIHGGEITEGAIDNNIRHALTKLSNYHFVSSEVYKQRVIQMGEPRNRVFNVGALGIEQIKRLQLLSRAEWESSCDFKLKSKNILITFHPETLKPGLSAKTLNSILAIAKEMSDFGVIITRPNHDLEGSKLNKILDKFEKLNLPHVKIYSSLGQLKYLSALKFVDIVIGNSSSGIIEVPYFKKVTINIGNRQTGRLLSKSIVNCGHSRREILSAIKTAYSPKLQSEIKKQKPLLGTGDSSRRIIKILNRALLEPFSVKTFIDLPTKEITK